MSLANTLCMQGYSRQAVERTRRALEEAQRVEHSVTLSIALRHAALLFLWIGDLRAAEDVIDWYISNARSHSLGPQIAVGRGFKAALAIRRGDAQSGVEALFRCMEELRAARYEMMTSAFNIALAEGLAATGQIGEGMKLTDEGIRRIEENGDFIYMPELLRVKGNLLLSMQQPRVEDAEMHFVRSLELSRRQGARAGELRTATDLAKLMAGQGRREAARGLLEPVFAWFVEGLDTADLKSAECVLAMLR
jgi:predicted ATPase